MNVRWGNIGAINGLEADVWIGNELVNSGRAERSGFNNVIIVTAGTAELIITPKMANVSIIGGRVNIRLITPRKVS
jgi:hypothetical protein